MDETRQLFITKKVNNDSKNDESKESKVRVPIACPSIELSMFCNNDNYSQKNKFNSEKYKMGRYFFDEIIMPKIKKLSKQVGFVYLCLYATDQTKKKNREDNIKNETNEKKLVKYYEKLNFKGLSDIQEEINTEFMDEDNDDGNSILIMPPQTDYEVNCCFMCQRLKFD